MSDTLEFKDLVVGKKILLVHAHSAAKRVAEITATDLEVSAPREPSMRIKIYANEDTLVYTEGGGFPRAWRFLAPDPHTGEPDAICVLKNWWYVQDFVH